MLLVRCALASLLGGLAVYSQTPQPRIPLLDTLVASNSRTLQFKDGKLQGPGAEFLLAESGAVQFVALGEEHNTTDIPQFTTTLFRALQDRYRFRFLATEQDPITLQRLSKLPVHGRRESVVAMAQRYPYAFTFVSDQELAMLAEIGATSRTAARPLWGCDQAFGATHILDWLEEITSSPTARKFIRNLRDTAKEKESKRDLSQYHYMAQEPKSELLTKLRETVQPKRGSEAEMLISSLIISDRIYRNYRERAFYDNAHEREEYMKHRFLDEYRRAMAIERTAPKVVLKFGHWHLYRGLGPSNQQTLGNFVSEFATANDSRSFHVAIYPSNAIGGYGELANSRDPILKLLAPALKTTEWTVVDLRPFRAQYGRLVRDMAPDLKESLRRWIFGYDAALFIGGMRKGTYHLNPGVEY